MRTTFDNPPDVPPPAGGYSHVARLELGDGALILVSGQLALGEKGELIGADDMSEQSERVFETLGAILAAHGASFGDVINIRTYLTDMNRVGDYAAVRRMHMEGHAPSSTTVEVTQLVIPGALLEVDVVAAVPAQA